MGQLDVTVLCCLEVWDGNPALSTAVCPSATALTHPTCHGCFGAWDLFPTEALDFPSEQLLSLCTVRLVWRGALPLGGIGRRINPPSQGTAR